MSFRTLLSYFSQLREKFYAGPWWQAMPPSRFLRLFAVFFFLIMFCWTLIVLFIDPYIYWHRAVGLPQVYSNAYAMIPGILRHGEYDTVLIGSSLSKNFRISEINRHLGVNAVKATAAGASGDDCRAFIREALAAGKVRRFVICTDIWSFTRKDKECRHQPYRHLYRPRNPLIYLYSLDTLEAVGEVLKSTLIFDSEKTKYDCDWDFCFFDAVYRYEYSREELERSILTDYIPPPHAETDPDEYFEKYIFFAVREHPEIRFDLFLPPCSIYLWCAMLEQGDLEAYLSVRSKLAELCAAFPNVHLYDFQPREEVICRLHHYKDITHYSPAINTWILEEMAAVGDGHTPADIEAGNDQLRELTAEHMPHFMHLRRHSHRKER